MDYLTFERSVTKRPQC